MTRHRQIRWPRTNSEAQCFKFETSLQSRGLSCERTAAQETHRQRQTQQFSPSTSCLHQRTPKSCRRNFPVMLRMKRRRASRIQRLRCTWRRSTSTSTLASRRRCGSKCSGVSFRFCNDSEITSEDAILSTTPGCSERFGTIDGNRRDNSLLYVRAHAI
jgi:hypothetical protein